MKQLRLRKLVFAVPLLVAVGCGGNGSNQNATPDGSMGGGNLDAPVAADASLDAPVVPADARADSSTGDAFVFLDGSTGGGDDGATPIDASTTTPDARADARRADASTTPKDAQELDAPLCAPIGDACNAPEDCCTAACDLFTHKCTEVGGCQGAGEMCGTTDDCCTGSCLLGRCTVPGCEANGTTCFEDGDCCSNNCQGTTCQPVPGSTCVTLGNSCGNDDQCCSDTCEGGKCINASGPFGCHATGDICFVPDDCCTDQCLIQPGATAGTCQDLHRTGSSQCIIDGLPCDNSENCCSRICAAVPGGGNVCQVATGCRINGDLCKESSDCCGAPGSMLPGDGNVICEIIEDSDPPIGSCRNPNGCNPEGNVCLDNAPNDCCGCDPPKFNCCKPDSLGVKRCFGPGGEDCPNGIDGTPGCCIMTGDVCAFADECCDDVPCVPDSEGVLRCATVQCIPPVECMNSSDTCCTSTADCCSGLECHILPGEPTGSCENPNPPPPPPPPDAGVADAAKADGPKIDAGPKMDAMGSGADATVTPDARLPDAAPPPDARLCSLLGQDCSVGAGGQPCCAGYACSNPTGGDCVVGETDCSCLTIIP